MKDQTEVLLYFPGTGSDLLVRATYEYTPGAPAVFYQRNGDPGWPAEGPEVDVIELRRVTANGVGPAIRLDKLPDAQMEKLHEQIIMAHEDRAEEDFND
jgi:hypothetical protein